MNSQQAFSDSASNATHWAASSSLWRWAGVVAVLAAGWCCMAYLPGSGADAGVTNSAPIKPAAVAPVGHATTSAVAAR
jgi:hypothetical protein